MGIGRVCFDVEFLGIEHAVANETLGGFFVVDVFKFEDGGVVVLEAIFFPEKGHEDAVHVDDEVGGFATVEDVVGEEQFGFSADASEFADFAYVEDFLLPDHSSLLILAPNEQRRCSMFSYPRSICSTLSMRLVPSALMAAMSSAMPARMSGLTMRQPLSLISLLCPTTTARCGSQRMICAPISMSLSTKKRRLSNIF